VVTGRVLPTDEGGRGGFVPSLVSGEVPRVYAGRLNTDVLAAGHMAMYRSTFESIGPFDEVLGAGARFPASDDNDYGYRLLAAGFQIRYVPEAVVYHRAWRRSSDYWRLRWNYGRGKGGFYAKHMRARDRHMLARLVRDVGLRLIRFPWRFLHRPRLALGDLPYVSGVVTGVFDWLWMHRKDI
jgi:GT2 family glycosyltransferase